MSIYFRHRILAISSFMLASLLFTLRLRLLQHEKARLVSLCSLDGLFANETDISPRETDLSSLSFGIAPRQLFPDEADSLQMDIPEEWGEDHNRGNQLVPFSHRDMRVISLNVDSFEVEQKHIQAS